jgi:dUTP pyrophosphatase
MNDTIKFAWIDDSSLGMTPSRKHSTDAGIDLCSAEFDYTLFPGEVKIFRTRLTVEIPEGYFGWITNKSKNNFLVGGGIVDQDYQGELLIKLFNPTEHVLVIETDQSIAQIILLPCYTPAVKMVDMHEIHNRKVERGASGGILSQLSDGTKYQEQAEAMDLDDYDYRAENAVRFDDKE